MVTAIVTILVFLVMITLHEFGHFIAAKLCGVKVLEFSIGMGPAIFKHSGKNTMYSLRIFPIGGYCKLDGEDGESDNDDAFCNQKLWKRFIVVSAGAILNLILGFVLFMVIVAHTGPVNSNIIGKVDSRSHLVNLDIRPGDKIVGVNGHKISFYNDIALYTSELEGDEEFELVIERNGKKQKYDILPSVDKTTVTYGSNSAVYIDEINGMGEQRKVDFEDGEIPDDYVGKTFTTTRYIIGFEPLKVEVNAANIVPQAWYYTKYVMKSIYAALWDMISGKSGLDNVSGPVGVAGVINDAVNSGKDRVINILFIVAMLTVNLGIFNLLPLPALDGGRLFFMIIELVRRKPIPPEKEGMVHAIGLMLLLLFAVVICFNDILKLVVR